MRVITASLIALMTLVQLSGCSEIKKSWKVTKDFYYAYMEPRSTINLDVSKCGDIEELRLASLFKPVDERIYTLCKFLDGEDQLPGQELFRALFDRFQWISGVIVVDTQGEVQFQHPADFSRSVDIKVFLASDVQNDVNAGLELLTSQSLDKTHLVVDQVGRQMVAVNNAASGAEGTLAEDTAMSKSFVENVTGMNSTTKPTKLRQREKKLVSTEDEFWSDHKMRVRSGNATFGPELYVVQPFFKESKWLGLIVVYFNPRELLEVCPEPNELIVLSSDKILWASKYQQEATLLIREPWRKILTKQVVGTWSHGGKTFYWLSRYLGNYYLIYAVATEKSIEKSCKSGIPVNANQVPTSSTPLYGDQRAVEYN